MTLLSGRGHEEEAHDHELGTAQEALVPADRYLGAGLPAKRLTLTYDDGPGRNTLAIAQYLNGLGIPATFFVSGCRFQGAPTPIAGADQTCLPQDQTVATRINANYLDQLTALGHRVANHSQDHARLDQLTAPQVRQQIRATHDLIAPHIPDDVFLLRGPRNRWNSDVANAVNAELPVYLGSFWIDVIPSLHDYQCLHVETAQSCTNYYLAAIGIDPAPADATVIVDRGIVLLHDRHQETELAGKAAQTTETLQLTQHLVPELRARGYVFVPLDAIPGVMGENRLGAQTLWTSQYSNSLGWALDPSYYLSIRYADIDGDGDDDVCGRDPGGIWCAKSNGTTDFTGPKFWLQSNFSDAHGWKDMRYGPTLQLADIDGDGDADICGRGAAGIYCSKSGGKQGVDHFDEFATWTPWSNTGDFSNADGWGANASNYLSIRLGDVNADGKADICGRYADGVWCATSTGSAFNKKTRWLSQDFTDALGYSAEHYGATLMLGDINGDDRADVCARANKGIRCGLAKTTGPGFNDTTLWTSGPFSNNDGWATSAAKYRSIHLADVNDDGRDDVCGRNDTGIVCAFAKTGAFKNYLHLLNDDFTDTDNWGAAHYGETVRFGDVNGDGLADACGRGNAGIYCSKAAEHLRGSL